MIVTHARFRKALGIGFAALVMATLSSAASAQSLKTWSHGVVAFKSDSGIVSMAGHKKFGKQFGIAIKYVQFKGDALALKALLAGAVDSYEGSPGAPLIAASHGADIKIVGCYWPGLTYGIFSKQSIKSPEDLKGKTLATSSPGALPDLVVRAVLEKYGITGNQIHFAPMGSDADRFRAVSAGIVDAAAASLEFVPLAEKEGNVKLLVNAHDAVPDYLRFCTYVTGQTMKEHGNEVADYLAAQMEGVHYAMAHCSEELALTRETIKAKPDDPRPAYIFDLVKKYSAVDPAMPIPVKKLAWMENLLIQTGNLKRKVDLSKMIDDSARLKALKLVAKSGK